ncbi:cyclic nucleotide-binding domain-containing protein 2 isoform X2 [Patella vulgata]|uniref:cyclic nucleotide-binding domain-containing protein 2 isoform X2 n=1 Tax=Patella vulgata TaxID=6465 RepID=UPI00217F8B7C|nr:cyclic nucleotide-binding domain-containing protein 2 isoform X2 [Patella vulgata]
MRLISKYLIFKVHVSPEAKTTLMLPPCYRTEEQRRVALLSLNTAVEVFSEFPVKMQKSIVKVGWYEFFESKRVIIRQGHLADNFYLILAGTAIVTVLDRDVKTGDVYSRTVALLKKGNSFGEIGLMRGSRRSATVTCRDDMEVLAVGRQDFIDIFMHIEHNKEPNHIQFLRTIDEFHGWPIQQLPYDNPKVCLFTYFRRGVLLCKDSNKSDWIFVVKTGSCRVLKSLKSTKPNLPPLDLGSYICSLDLSKSLPPLKALNCNSLTSSIRNGSWSKQQFNLQYNSNKLKGNNSLDILNRGPTELENHAEEHLRELDILLNRKEEDSFNKLHDFPPDHQDKMVFVEIQKLGARDTYGLESVLFGMMRKTTSTSLVSEGTECILINRKFFLQHLSEDVAKIIRTKIRPLPTDHVLQQKLQTKTNWEAYKALTVADHIIYKQQVQQSLGYG